MDVVPRLYRTLSRGLVGLSAGLLAMRAVTTPSPCHHISDTDKDADNCVRLNVTAENPAIVGFSYTFWPYRSLDKFGPKFIAGRLDRALLKTCVLECPMFTNASYPNVPNATCLDTPYVTITPSATPTKVYHWYALEKTPDVTYSNLPGDWELVNRKTPDIFDKTLQGIGSFVFSTKGPSPDSALMSMVSTSIIVLAIVGLFIAVWYFIHDWYGYIFIEASNREEERQRYIATVEGLIQRVAQLEAANRKIEKLQRDKAKSDKAESDAETNRIKELEAEVKRVGRRNDTLHGNFSNQQREARKHDQFAEDTLSRMADMEHSVDGIEKDLRQLKKVEQQIRDGISYFERSLDGTKEDIQRLEKRDDLMLRLTAVEEVLTALKNHDSEVSTAIAGYGREFSGHQQLLVKYQDNMREHVQDVLGRIVTLEGSRHLESENTQRIEDLAQATVDLATHHTEVRHCCDNLSMELQKNREFIMGEIERHIAAHDTRHKAMDSQIKSLDSRYTTLDTRSMEMVDSVKEVAGLREDVRNMDTRQKALDAAHRNLDGRQDDIDDRQKAAFDDINARLTALGVSHKVLKTQQTTLDAALLDVDTRQKAAHEDYDARLTALDSSHKDLNASNKALETRQDKTESVLIDLDAKQTTFESALQDNDTLRKAEHDDLNARHTALDARHKSLESLIKTLDARAQDLAARQSAMEKRSKEMRDRVINACNSLGSWNHKAGEEFNVVLQNFEGFEGSMVAALSATFHALHHIHARVLPPVMPRPGFPGSPGFSPARPMHPQLPPGPFPQPQWPPQNQWVQSQWAPVQAPHGLQGPVVQSSAPQSPAPQGNAATPRQQGTPGKGPQAQTPSK